jgi:hypothetical protein
MLDITVALNAKQQMDSAIEIGHVTFLKCTSDRRTNTHKQLQVADSAGHQGCETLQPMYLGHSRRPRF